VASPGEGGDFGRANAALRDEPRFRELVARLELPDPS